MVVCGAMVQKGALDLMSMLLVPIVVAGVLTMKIYLPPGFLILLAGCILLGSILSLKGATYLVYGLLLAGLCISVMALQYFLPVAILVRLAITVIFLALLKVLVL